MANEQDQDHAFRILENAPIDLDTKAGAWDDFYESASAKDLDIRLRHVDIPDSVHDALVAARKSIEPSHRERILEAIKKLSTLDPKVLATAENHPNLLRYLVEAAKHEAEE